MSLLANMKAKIGRRALRPMIIVLATTFLCLSLFGSTSASASVDSNVEQGQSFTRNCESQGGGKHGTSHKPDLCCAFFCGQTNYRWPLASGSWPLSVNLKPAREFRLLRLSAPTTAPARAPLGSGGAWSSRAPPSVS